VLGLAGNKGVGGGSREGGIERGREGERVRCSSRVLYCTVHRGHIVHATLYKQCFAPSEYTHFGKGQKEGWERKQTGKEKEKERIWICRCTEFTRAGDYRQGSCCDAEEARQPARWMREYI